MTTFDFDDLNTVADIDQRYKDLYWSLSEAHRKAHERIKLVRLAAEAKNAKIAAKSESESKEQPQPKKPATSTEIREWARRNNVRVNAKGPVHPDVKAAYAATH